MSRSPSPLTVAQSAAYELGEKIYVPLRSSILNEDRTAEVILPREFKADSDQKYEAIYILDGIRAYHYVAYDYLRGEGFIPKRTILVGLLGLKDTATRYRDFTPTKLSADSGGADLIIALQFRSLKNGTWARRLTQSPEVGFGL